MVILGIVFLCYGLSIIFYWSIRLLYVYAVNSPDIIDSQSIVVDPVDSLFIDTLYTEIVVGIWLVSTLFDVFENKLFLQFVLYIYVLRFFFNYKMFDVKKYVYDIRVSFLFAIFNLLMFSFLVVVNLVYLI